ncbi:MULTISPECIES: GMC family oxidoreductase N-terminal domain-containing protein [Halomonadaceae]|uniref:GMC family oxidoreductase N-terminal domain-containing protein n=1 Tax=Vreelandella glaciei TaxID=186761 RepID=A0A7Z0RZG0_9GAMM|nr:MULTISPECIES: GMC family oxidoreductase N-terminal domain-containing protein [Halomonas]NYS78813.1 GMC family oxidoreductase N-terminal domain-containing protein [Halomonas glaciei]|tara:strand:+ start:1528 stop:3210 length:1683 start_codon:yes stop_codon:yes gene_type:complete
MAQQQSQAAPNAGLEFDYIVVGAGTAGCLLANRLSANPNHRVLLIEAGGRDNYHWIHIPVGYLYCINNPRTDWLFRTEPDKGLNGRSLIYPRGKTLGGCSSINGMIYMRGQARDYDHWADVAGDDAWKWENCLSDFIKHEDHYRLDDGGDADAKHRDFHGHGGEWRIEKQRLKWQVLDDFAEAAVQAGIPRTEDFNRGTNEGVAYFEVNQRSGWRWNTAKAFLRPALKRDNLTLWHSTQVNRLLFEKRGEALRCAGVEVERGGQVQRAMVSGEVVLCAGAIGTPHLLQLSGVGSRELLDEHGVEVVHELPGVGENLQDHLQIRSIYKITNGKTLNAIASTLLGKAGIGLEYLLKRTGPMSMAPSQLGAFTRSSKEQTYPNIQYHVQPLSLEAFGQPLHPYPAITASVCNLNPTSRGTVRLKSSDPRQAPAISPNYLSTAEDRKVAADSLRVTRRIAEQTAFAKYAPEEVKPGVEYQTDDELTRLAGDIGTTIFHPVGTAKMGREDDAMAVVDSRLRVHGISGLRVADASIMPTITSGNTNSPTLMIAEKAAGWLLAERGQ